MSRRGCMRPPRGACSAGRVSWAASVHPSAQEVPHPARVVRTRAGSAEVFPLPALCLAAHIPSRLAEEPRSRQLLHAPRACSSPGGEARVRHAPCSSSLPMGWRVGLRDSATPRGWIGIFSRGDLRTMFRVSLVLTMRTNSVAGRLRPKRGEARRDAAMRFTPWRLRCGGELRRPAGLKGCEVGLKEFRACLPVERASPLASGE